MQEEKPDNMRKFFTRGAGSSWFKDSVTRSLLGVPGCTLKNIIIEREKNVRFLTNSCKIIIIAIITKIRLNST